MNTISATDFKAKCLAIMNEVSSTGESITITKHGKPIAQINPVTEKSTSIIGMCAGNGMVSGVKGDIMAPVLGEDEWFNTDELTQ